MGDHADDAWDYMDSRSWYSVYERDYYVSIKKQRRAPVRILNCPSCKATNLRFLEEETDKWYLGEVDEKGDVIRHVCKFKRRFR